jgi:hypothetical protein
MHFLKNQQKILPQVCTAADIFIFLLLCCGGSFLHQRAYVPLDTSVAEPEPVERQLFAGAVAEVFFGPTPEPGM